MHPNNDDDDNNNNNTNINHFLQYFLMFYTSRLEPIFSEVLLSN